MFYYFLFQLTLFYKVCNYMAKLFPISKKVAMPLHIGA